MLQFTKSKALSSAVLAALPAMLLLGWSSSANAQYQTGGNGHALDANNRVGSGGFNGNGTPHTDYNVNNNVITGNSSGFSYFHDNKTNEFDPNVFQGETGSSSFNKFNNISTPTDLTQRQTGQPNYVPVYNSGSYVGPPPSNYVPTPGGVGYIPAPEVSPLTATGYDTRTNLINTDPTRGNLPSPGQLDVAGPVDPSTGNQSMYSMNPLYGVRPSDTAGGTQESIFNKTTNTRILTPADRAKLTPGDIQKMRDELNTTVIPTDQTNQSSGTVTPVPGVVNVSVSQELTNPAATPTNLATGQALNSTITNPSLGGGVNSGESVQNQLIVPPAKQSTQLKDLEKRFAEDKKRLTDVEATERYNQERQALSQTGVGGTDKTPKPGDTHTADKTPATPAPQPILTKPETAEANQPYIITSLATGINAKGLATLMKTAEDLMRQGKFTEAVDTYDTAEQVAPNNPFVALGRGFAELGASYYGKADQDLNRAITTEPALLAGRYDLKGFLGEDRLKFVHDDLADIADHEKGSRPLVLLGFIAHNNGDDELAATDLTEAAKRGGYADLVKLMRETWKLK